MDLDIKIVQDWREANAVTHSADHHADEVIATAMLGAIFNLRIYRTKDRAKIEKIIARNSLPYEGVIVYDIGGEYDPENMHYDHHQQTADEEMFYPDGIKRATAGLIWREHGIEIVQALSDVDSMTEACRVAGLIGRRFVHEIDAYDNGMGVPHDGMTLSEILPLFNATREENRDSDVAFMEAVEMAARILERLAITTLAEVRDRNKVEELIGRCDDCLLVMNAPYNGWVDAILESEEPQAKKLLYAIFPGKGGHWCVQAVPPDAEHKFAQRLAFPEDWRGLYGEALEEVTGVTGAIFCHPGGFFTTAATLEKAVMLANKAVR